MLLCALAHHHQIYTCLSGALSLPVELVGYVAQTLDRVASLTDVQLKAETTVGACALTCVRCAGLAGG